MSKWQLARWHNDIEDLVEDLRRRVTELESLTARQESDMNQLRSQVYTPAPSPAEPRCARCALAPLATIHRIEHESYHPFTPPPPEPPATLLEAVRDLYYAAVWSADRPVDEAKLWTAVRDAAGFPPGQSPKPSPPATGCPGCDERVRHRAHLEQDSLVPGECGNPHIYKCCAPAPPPAAPKPLTTEDWTRFAESVGRPDLAPKEARRWTLHRYAVLSLAVFHKWTRWDECTATDSRPCFAEEHIRVIELTPAVMAALDSVETVQKHIEQAASDAAEVKRLRAQIERVDKVAKGWRCRSEIAVHHLLDELDNALRGEEKPYFRGGPTTGEPDHDFD
jgi:hypothetical protein